MTSKDNRIVDKSRRDSSDTLKALKKNIIRRAVLCVITIVLTLILLFSLTLAWSTNVVHTGGLSFKTEKWSFSGDITVFGDTYEIAPGDEGLVSMRLANDGESVVAAGVTVSKKQMSESMQKRIYFYVEDSAVRNGELTERVWVASTGGYTYTLFPNSMLIINDTEQNAPALRWEWVYDVLGYYVMGTHDGVNMQISDYIRPVEYDFDFASTTFDENGRLLTVDGYKTAEEFIAELSANDGYSGEIQYSGVTADGYYPVSVDLNGKGIWLYLCTYSEVIAAMEEDTYMGESAEEITCRAIVNVTGQNVNEEDVVVDSEEKLAAALMNPVGAIIRLSGDMTLENTLTLAENKSAMIDLGGHTLTSSADAIFDVGENATLSLLNGEVRGTDVTTAALKVTGADVTLSGIVVNNVEEGVIVADNKSDGADSRIHLIGCNITAKEDGIILYGNGNASEANTSLVVNNCTIVGENYSGIICNGTYWGTTVRITDSEISGYYTAIYHPQKNSIMNIETSLLTGWTGIAVKGGIVNIESSVIRGTGESFEPTYSLSGWTDTGDGVYLEANYEWSTEVNLTGSCTVASAYGEAVRMFSPDAENAKITVSGGTYSTDVSQYLAEGCTVSETEGGFAVNAPVTE